MELTIREPFRLVYVSGNEHAPGDPTGRVTLEIRGDGACTIHNVRLGGANQRSFAGATTPAVIGRILDHLRDGGFPIVPPHPIPAGSALRNLLIQSGGEEAHAFPTAWHAVETLAGYREAYVLLDSIVTLVSGSALKLVASPDVGLAVPTDR